MAVIVQYIVVRDGDEKMTFTTKKEADAYDKMLDIADNLFDFFENSDINIDETRKEEISLLLAEKRDEVVPILKGVSPKAATSRKKNPPSSETAKTRGKAPVKQPGSKQADTSEAPEAKPVPKSAAKSTPRTKAASSKKSVQTG